LHRLRGRSRGFVLVTGLRSQAIHNNMIINKKSAIAGV
jgi:hypothetical protein